MKVKVSEASGGVLDYLVFKTKPFGDGTYWQSEEFAELFSPSRNWAQGGPIIERNDLAWERVGGGYQCGFVEGNTILEACMRCYVSSKLGDEVEVPDELIRSI